MSNTLEIELYGVKGQRWGVIRPNLSASRKKLSDLTDAELRTAVNRLRLEKEFTQLTANSATNKKGSSHIAQALSKYGGKALDRTVNKLVGKAVDASIKKITS